MKKKLFTVLVAGALIVSLSAVAFAGSSIKIFYNGEEIRSDVSPINISGRILIPVRAVAEAMGAKVEWDKDSNQINITGSGQDLRIANLERALAPKSSLEAVNSWAEAVKTRNGAWQYAVMNPALKERFYEELSSMGWSTGTSSPWVKSFDVKELGKTGDGADRYSVTFTWTDSTNATSKSTDYVTVKNVDDVWLLDSIAALSLKGEITEINANEDGITESVFIKGRADSGATYEEGLAIIGENTKIYKGYTDTELKPDDIKEGSRAEVFYSPGPMIMIYPPQALADEIRIFE